MACGFACRERKTWKMLFSDLFHFWRRGGLRSSWTRKYYYDDLIYYPVMRLICKYFGHVPEWYDERQEDCDCIVCKRCRKILNK